MEKFAHELEFISIINRNGIGTRKVNKKYLKCLFENKFTKDEVYKVYCLSITEKTYIAFNFNVFVVRLKQ